MKSLCYLSFLFLLFSLNIFPTYAQKDVDKQIAKAAEEILEKGIQFYHSIAIKGGYVYHYSLDLKEKWGEGKTDNFTIEVQPPGTPAVGMSFLKAYRLTRNPDFLQAAKDAAYALIEGQNDLGGWEHKIYFQRPKGRKVSFDDDQTQSAIRFLMSLDEFVDDDKLTQAIERALDMMLSSQQSHGGWPHQYPYQGNYHDYATFNDGGINDCIKVMLMADQLYGKPQYTESLAKVGRFLLISQLPPPQPGWAQQYNEFLQPAWARSFEPPAVCPSASVKNLHSLMDLYLYTGNRTYLEAIPDVIRWLNESKMPNGKWGRFLELGTNKALYYDRGRIRVDRLEDLSLERRTGYGYEQDLSNALLEVEKRFTEVKAIKIEKFPFQASSLTQEETLARIKELRPLVRKIIDSQDKQGRWIKKEDRFRTETRPWDGSYRVEDRISSALFNRNVVILCEYLTLTQFR